MSFYGQVLQELMVAIGAALLVANVRALMNRKADRAAIAERTVTRARPGSPVRGYRISDNPEYAVAPIGRSLLYAAIGTIVMIWGIASLVS